MEPGSVVQLVECLFSMHKALCQMLTLGDMGLKSKHSGGGKQEDQEVQSLPLLHSKFEASQGYRRHFFVCLFLKRKDKKTTVHDLQITLSAGKRVRVILGLNFKEAVGKMTQQLKSIYILFLQKIQVLFTAHTLGSSQLPVPPALGDPVPYSGLCGQCTPIYLHAVLKINKFCCCFGLVLLFLRQGHTVQLWLSWYISLASSSQRSGDVCLLNARIKVCTTTLSLKNTISRKNKTQKACFS